MITPINYIKKAIFNPEGAIIFTDDGNRLADVRGFGAINKLFSDDEKAIQFHDEIGAFIADAINEKIERDSEKPESDLTCDADDLIEKLSS